MRKRVLNTFEDVSAQGKDGNENDNEDRYEESYHMINIVYCRYEKKETSGRFWYF